MPEKEKIIKEEHTEERGGSYTPYYLDLGTFEESNEGSYKNSKSGKENNPFKWKVIEEYDNFDDAYKGYRAYIQKQMNYDREDLEKVWASGRIDLRLRHGPKMLDWTGMYVRESNPQEEDAKQIKGKDPIEAQKERDSAVCLRDAADMVDELNDRALSHLYNLFSHETVYVLEGGVMENINPEMATESANGIYHLVYKITNFTTSVSEEKPVVNAGKLVTNYNKYNISPETVKKFFKIDERVKIQIDNSKSYILSFAISDFNKEKIESAHSKRDSASFALHIQCTPVEVEEEFNKYLESESEFQEDSVVKDDETWEEEQARKNRELAEENAYGFNEEAEKERIKRELIEASNERIEEDRRRSELNKQMREISGGKYYTPRSVSNSNKKYYQEHEIDKMYRELSNLVRAKGTLEYKVQHPEEWEKEYEDKLLKENKIGLSKAKEMVAEKRNELEEELATTIDKINGMKGEIKAREESAKANSKELSSEEVASSESTAAKSREEISKIDFGEFREYKDEYLKYLELTGNSTILPNNTIDKIASEGIKDLGGKLYKPEDPEEFRILFRRINKHLMNEFAKKRVLPSDRERREEIRQGIAERSGLGPNQSRSGPLRSNKFNLYDPKGFFNKKEPRQWGKKI